MHKLYPRTATQRRWPRRPRLATAGLAQARVWLHSPGAGAFSRQCDQRYGGLPGHPHSVRGGPCGVARWCVHRLEPAQIRAPAIVRTLTTAAVWLPRRQSNLDHDDDRLDSWTERSSRERGYRPLSVSRVCSSQAPGGRESVVLSLLSLAPDLRCVFPPDRLQMTTAEKPPISNGILVCAHPGHLALDKPDHDEHVLHNTCITILPGFLIPPHLTILRCSQDISDMFLCCAKIKGSGCVKQLRGAGAEAYHTRTQ